MGKLLSKVEGRQETGLHPRSGRARRAANGARTDLTPLAPSRGLPQATRSAGGHDCRRKRNVSEYDAVGTVSEKEAEDLIAAVQEFKIDAEHWLRSHHTELL